MHCTDTQVENVTNRLPAMGADALAVVREFETEVLLLPQLDVDITHTFHAGVYARTLLLPKDAVVTGALFKIPTLLIVSGDALVYSGDETLRITGYHILHCEAGRKTVCLALDNTSFTMLFATQARTIDEAEREFTDEYERLTTRKGK